MATSGKARAHTNIALIKYWGKANEEEIIPMNNSLSVALDRFYTETKVTFSETYDRDVLILNGEEVSDKESAKIRRFMDIVREKGQTSDYALIESENFVPTAAGLASSASAYAALAAACDEALHLQLSRKICHGLRVVAQGRPPVASLVVSLSGKRAQTTRLHIATL